MLYAFDAQDVVRIRKLLIAFEQGRLARDIVPVAPPSQAGRQDTWLGRIATQIAAATVSGGITTAGVGTAIMQKVDYTTNPPTFKDLTNTDKIYTVINYLTTPLPPGFYLLAREPSSGNYVPVSYPPAQWEGSFFQVNSVNVASGQSTDTWPNHYTQFNSLALPYPGTYLVTVSGGALLQVNNSLWTNSGIIRVYVKETVSNTNLTNGGQDVCELEANAASGSSVISEARNDFCLPFVVTVPAGATGNISALASGFGTGIAESYVIGQNTINAVLIGTPGAPTLTVNGLTGGVTIGAADGGGQSAGVGTAVTTAGQTVNVGQNAAGIAAQKAFLAGQNW